MKMSSSKLTKTRQLLIDEFIRCLKEEDITWEKSWKVVHQVNAISSHVYHGINCLLLSFVAESRHYTDPRWLTFNQIKSNGWKLENAKGQGIPIEYWSAYDKEEKKSITLAEANLLKASEPDRVGFIVKTYVVFNAGLVNGIPPYEIEEKTVEHENIRDFFDNYLENESIALEHGGNDACYIPSLDKIRMPHLSRFKDELSYYDVLAHEIAHSTGHSNRLGRDLSGTFGSEKYAREELRAELTSAFLNAELNIPPSEERMNNHKAYVQSWIKILEDHPNELFKAIQDAENIKDYVIEKGDLEFYINNDTLNQQKEYERGDM